MQKWIHFNDKRYVIYLGIFSLFWLPHNKNQMTEKPILFSPFKPTECAIWTLFPESFLTGISTHVVDSLSEQQPNDQAKPQWLLQASDYNY